MRRRDLLRTINQAAKESGLVFAELRNKGDHEIYSLNGQRVSVPRHTEINEITARGILNTLAETLGKEKDWWRK
jgi:predicted RNA binding protein YcfA (HicA-like mRNA interferase family)